MQQFFSGDGLEHEDFRNRLAYFLNRWRAPLTLAANDAEMNKTENGDEWTLSHGLGISPFGNGRT